MNQSDNLLNITEGASYIGLTAISLRRRCSEKWVGLRPRFFRIGNRLKFKKADLDEYIRFYENAPATNAGSKEPITGVATE